MGFVGGVQGQDIPNILDAWIKNYTVRGIWTGSRQHMEEMCRAMAANLERLRPVIDSRVFKLDQLKEAFKYFQEGKHQGKVVIEMG